MGVPSAERLVRALCWACGEPPSPHFYVEDKLTYAATPQKNWVVDRTIAELEQKLDRQRFCRVHRSTLVNLEFVDELYPWFGGKMILRLKDLKKTEITVARDRLRDLKDRLGL